MIFVGASGNVSTNRNHSEVFISDVLVMQCGAISQVICLPYIVLFTSSTPNYVYYVLNGARHVCINGKDFTLKANC